MQVGFGRAHPSAQCGAHYNPCLSGAYPAFYLPVVYVPVAICREDDGGHPMRVPHDVEVQSAASPQTVTIGGLRKVSLSLEYLVEAAAASPAVTLTTSFGGTTSAWSDAKIAPGYHVQEAVISVQPGTQATLAVTNAMARLRWFETI